MSYENRVFLNKNPFKAGSNEGGTKISLEDGTNQTICEKVRTLT